MLFDGKPYTFDRVIRIGITVGLLWGFIWLLGYLSDVLIPFAIALLLAYLINPLVQLVQRKIPNRLISVVFSLFAVAVFLALTAWLLIPAIVQEIGQMGHILSRLVIHRKVEKYPLSSNTQRISFFEKSLAGKCHKSRKFC